MQISNHSFLVTGAGSGIGRELVKQLVNQGAKVAMVDIHESALEETESLVDSSQVSKHVIDISNRESVKNLPDQISSTIGPVDGIINNAGIIQPFVDVNDLGFDTIEKIMTVNFYGTVNMTKTFLPLLLQRPEGHIANIASMGGFIPFPGQTIYSASKAAVKIFTEGLYSELKNTNVGVTVIFPGAVDTNIMSNSGLKQPDASDTEKSSFKPLPAPDAAAQIITAIERNKFRATVGKDSRMLDLLYRFNPKMAVDTIVKKMSGMKH